MDKYRLYTMEYTQYRLVWINIAWILGVLLVIKPVYIAAQTEGDTGYEYNEAYDEYDEESGIEPTFDVPLVNVTVVAGQTAVLSCSIEDLGRYKVAWLDQNNMPLTYDDRRFVDDFRFSVVRPYIKEWNLQIRDIRWEDQGQYRCTINTLPPKSKSVVLHVKVPAHIIDELSTNDVTFQEGDTVVLVCNVTGVPRPEVTWYRRPASTNINKRERIGHVGEVIIIKNVSRYCDDIYECVADNGVPPAVSRQMRVTVEFAPEITMPNARIGQELGKETILECIITAFPQSVSYWEKNGKEISSTTGGRSGKYRVQPYEEGEHTMTLSLRVHDIEPSDYGQYRCVARNNLGDDAETMYLYRYETPEEERDDRIHEPVKYPHHTTPWPRERNPTYKVEPNEEHKKGNNNRYWENTAGKLSSNSDPLARCNFILLTVCCVLATVDMGKAISTTL